MKKYGVLIVLAIIDIIFIGGVRQSNSDMKTTGDSLIVNIGSQYGFTYDGGGSDPAPIKGQHINIIGFPLVQVTLDPGEYKITNAAGLQGANYSAWSYNYPSAWYWGFVVADNSTNEVVLYGDAGTGTVSTAEELANLSDVINFETILSLSKTTTLNFTLRDFNVSDNRGGISLKIEELNGITDSDEDGVIDQWDTCPDTPFNSWVNNTGCHVSGLYTEEQMNQMVEAILTWGDTDGDKKITLIEAIKALRVTSGVIK